MSERKVLNKYLPPDFDPSKIPRRKMAADRQQVVRLMAPFSMRCNTCGEYIYKGKKFNARKETAQGEEYYGIKIFRFYIKCTQCSAEITFKTDPKNTDYVAEHGASRNFEPWRDEKANEEEDKLARLEEEEGDPMKALENRTLDSRREMEILDALQDIRTRNARNERVDASGLIGDLDQLGRGKGKAILSPEEEERIRAEEEDEALVRKIFSRAEDIELPDERGDAEREEALGSGSSAPEAGPSGPASTSGSGSNHSNSPPTPTDTPAATAAEGAEARARVVKRQLADAEPDVQSLLSERARAALEGSKMAAAPPPKKKKKSSGSAFGIVRKKA